MISLDEFERNGNFSNNYLFFCLQAALSMSAWRPSEDHERLHIDSGPRINALHFISEALDIPRSERQTPPREVGPNVSLEPAVTYSADIPQQQDDEDSSLAGSPPEGAALPGQHLLNNHPHQNFSSETPYNTPAGVVTGSSVTTKTIVAADGDVSNGFVMSGRSLPYVFEASESGKNYSLISIFLFCLFSCQNKEIMKKSFIKKGAQFSTVFHSSISQFIEG